MIDHRTTAIVSQAERRERERERRAMRRRQARRAAKESARDYYGHAEHEMSASAADEFESLIDLACECA